MSFGGRLVDEGMSGSWTDTDGQGQAKDDKDSRDGHGRT